MRDAVVRLHQQLDTHRAAARLLELTLHRKITFEQAALLLSEKSRQYALDAAARKKRIDDLGPNAILLELNDTSDPDTPQSLLQQARDTT